MDTNVLKHFIILAKTLSYTKAAEELEKSESVISRQIARLEQELGLRLFDRKGRSITLTPQGKVLADGVKDLFDRFDLILDEAKAIQNGSRGILRFGVINEQLLQTDTIDIINGFKRKYPDIFWELISTNTCEMIEHFTSGEVDFVFGALFDFDYLDDVETVQSSFSDKHLVIPATHPMASRDPMSLSLNDFRDDVFLFSREQAEHLGELKALCEDFGFRLKYAFAPQESGVINLIVLSEGITISDATHFIKEDKNLRIIPLPELGKLKTGFIRRKNSTNPCIDLFFDYLRAVLGR